MLKVDETTVIQSKNHVRKVDKANILEKAFRLSLAQNHSLNTIGTVRKEYHSFTRYLIN